MTALTRIRTRRNCTDCPRRREHFFCNFSGPVLDAFEAIKVPVAYPKNVSIFAEGQPSAGVYLLCAGRVKISTYSQDGKAIILRIAEAGEVLGISSAIGGDPHEVTASAIEDCLVNYIHRSDFLRFLHDSGEAGLNVARQLAQDYQRAHTQLCAISLSNTASEKLLRLLLGWCPRNGGNGREVNIQLGHTHEEMAEMIGSSRETVTRLFRTFKDSGLINVNGRALSIPDRARLEQMVGSRPPNGNGKYAA